MERAVPSTLLYPLFLNINQFLFKKFIRINMSKKTIGPYGSWKSPITMDTVLAYSVRFYELGLDGESIYWLEGRPQESGRCVIVKRSPEGNISDQLPAPFNTRSRVHEYGGGAFVVDDGTLYFTHFNDQRIYCKRGDADPFPLTEEGKCFYADFRYDRKRDRLIGVREDHRDENHEPINTIVSVDLKQPYKVEVLASGKDFYSSPRISPDGRHLTWLSWDHPNMPWDGCEVSMAKFANDGSLDDPVLVAGGLDESIFQPEWSPDNILYFVSDRTGWWNIYRYKESKVEALYPMEAEFGQSQWVFGMSKYGFESEQSILCAYSQDGVWNLARLDTVNKSLEKIDTPYTLIENIQVGAGKVAFLGGSPTEASAVLTMDLKSREIEVIRKSNSLEVDSSYLSVPMTMEFPTEDKLKAHGFFYPPNNKDLTGPSGELPPLIAVMHGGPTGATDAVLDYGIQFWTSRGFAVFDINYGGSTGYGTEYRRRLNGRWGEVDLNDCENGARYLADEGYVDFEKMAIRGGSAGGYTVLSALTFGQVYRTGASYYGVSDLEILAKDTHKFESRYLDKIIGPYPESAQLYRDRSPLYHLDKLGKPIIFFQGLEDNIVPPNQAEMMVEALRKKGVPVAYIAFEVEQHGFREAKNIKRATEAELYFYAKIFGFEPADRIEPVNIENI